MLCEQNNINLWIIQNEMFALKKMAGIRKMIKIKSSAKQNTLFLFFFDEKRFY